WLLHLPIFESAEYTMEQAHRTGQRNTVWHGHCCYIGRDQSGPDRIDNLPASPVAGMPTTLRKTAGNILPIGSGALPGLVSPGIATAIADSRFQMK
ncbi:MAG: hypothetical protein LJE65_01935, partial [Desulfobacteraceae bacterium]|nr:hypothetical protein [Desulfobacteraceae bacterium]